MSNCIKSDLYMMLYKKTYLFFLVICPLLGMIISVMNSIIRLGDSTYENIILHSYKFLFYTYIAFIIIIIYSVLFEFIDSGFIQNEIIQCHIKSKIILSKYIIVCLLIPFFFVLIPLLVYICTSKVIMHDVYADLIIRNIAFGLILFRISFDCVSLVFIFKESGFYFFATLTMWYFIPGLIKKMTIGKFRIYKLTWEYQMSLITSNGMTNEMFFKYVIPFELLSLSIHFIIMGLLVYIFFREREL